MAEETGQVGSTRSFETTEGPLSYQEISERLAVSLARLVARLLEAPAEEIVITPEWLCKRHEELAGHLFPEWAGRFILEEVLPAAAVDTGTATETPIAAGIACPCGTSNDADAVFCKRCGARLAAEEQAP